MAAITISSPSGAQTNPTDTRLPFNNGGVFGDSMLVQANTNVLFSEISGGIVGGFYFNNSNGTYLFGDVDASFTGNRIQILPGGNIETNSTKLVLNVDSQIDINGLVTAVSAGGSAGLHLELTINNTKYKIALLNV